jgi:predicted ATPase
VAPLALPLDEDDADSLARVPAVALLCERARAHDPDFRLCEANADAVAEICRRLDALPLAIELAAARTRTLSPEEILAGVPAGTLRATLDWTHRLLDPRGRELFAALAVFVGGFTTEAAHAVCAASSAALPELVDASLVVGGPPHRMLAPVREYALERLEENGDVDGVRLRHAEWSQANAAGSHG